MTRYLIVLFVVTILFSSCSNKTNSISNEEENNELILFFNSILVERANHIEYYLNNLEHYHHFPIESKIRKSDTLELNLIHELTEINEEIVTLGLPIIGGLMNLDSTFHYIESLKHKIIPFQDYVWLLELEQSLREFERVPLSEIHFKWIMIAARKHIEARSNHYYRDGRNSVRKSRRGNMILLKSSVDTFYTVNGYYEYSKGDLKIDAYTISGEKISSKYYDNVDSIKLSTNGISLYVVTHKDRYNYIEYIKVGEIEDDRIIKIAEKYRETSLQDWMEDYIEKLFFTSFSYDYDKYNRIRMLWSDIEFKYYGEHNYDRLLQIWNHLYDVFYQETAFKNSNVLDTLDPNVNKEEVHISKAILKQIERKRKLSTFSYFNWIRTFILHYRYKMTYCRHDPFNNQFSIYNEPSDSTGIILYTGDIFLYYDNSEIRKFGSQTWEKELYELEFPLTCNIKKSDGSIYKSDSIQLENLYFYSTN